MQENRYIKRKKETKMERKRKIRFLNFKYKINNFVTCILIFINVRVDQRNQH